MHAIGELHEIPRSSLPGELGTGWIDHIPRLQRSTKAPLESEPTAKHAVLDGQDTLMSSPLAGPEICCVDHDPPFQRSANGDAGTP